MKQRSHPIFYIVLVVALVAAVAVIYRYTVYPKDIAKNCELMELVDEAVQSNAEIIYLGESSDFTVASYDSDHRSICRMMADSLDGPRVCDMASAATHAGVFYDMMNRLPHKSNIHTAVVTVNMRSFTAEWIYSKLETPLRKQQLLLRRGPALWRKAQLVFKDYPRWDEKERDRLIVKHLRRQAAPLPYANARAWDVAMADSLWRCGANPDTIAMTCHYIKCFSTVIDETNPRIRDLDRIVKLCNKRGWRLIMHILPDDEEQMAHLVGPNLVQMLRANGRFVKERYTAMGVTVVDNQGLLPHSSFSEPDYPTEHYDQTGRKLVADHIVEAMIP